MRRDCSSLGGFFAVVLLASSASAQTPPAADTTAYQNRCASCHGPAMAGASGPAILTYIRYHTDTEVAAAIRERHRDTPAVSVQGAELGQILAGVRVLAGTNPAMATGGFTGRRGGAGGGGGRGAANAPAAPAAAAPARGRGAGAASAPSMGTSGVQPSTIKMADGRARSGPVPAETSWRRTRRTTPRILNTADLKVGTTTVVVLAFRPASS